MLITGLVIVILYTSYTIINKIALDYIQHLLFIVLLTIFRIGLPSLVHPLFGHLYLVRIQKILLRSKYVECILMFLSAFQGGVSVAHIYVLSLSLPHM